MLNNKIIIIQYNHIIIIRTSSYNNLFALFQAIKYKQLQLQPSIPVIYLETVKKPLSSMEVSKLREFILQYKVYNIYIYRR
jgi:hypothetical protein